MIISNITFNSSNVRSYSLQPKCTLGYLIVVIHNSFFFFYISGLTQIFEFLKRRQKQREREKGRKKSYVRIYYRHCHVEIALVFHCFKLLYLSLFLLIRSNCLFPLISPLPPQLYHHQVPSSSPLSSS